MTYFAYTAVGLLALLGLYDLVMVGVAFFVWHIPFSRWPD